MDLAEARAAAAFHPALRGTMRVVVGSERSMKSRQAELERHLDAMSRYVECDKDRPSRLCTLVLRSAASVPAQALILMKDTLADAGVRARVILANLQPQDDLKQLFDTLSSLSPGAEGTALIRWARDARLLEAHEQVTYGTKMCWAGDAMRRDADKRNSLVLFEMNAPNAARRAARAFHALWDASVRVPGRHLETPRLSKPSCAYDPMDDAPASAKDTTIQVWPLVRH
jgi:hypothetical protein